MPEVCHRSTSSRLPRNPPGAKSRHPYRRPCCFLRFPIAFDNNYSRIDNPSRILSLQEVPSDALLQLGISRTTSWETFGHHPPPPTFSVHTILFCVTSLYPCVLIFKTRKILFSKCHYFYNPMVL